MLPAKNYKCLFEFVKVINRNIGFAGGKYENIFTFATRDMPRIIL